MADTTLVIRHSGSLRGYLFPILNFKLITIIDGVKKFY